MSMNSERSRWARESVALFVSVGNPLEALDDFAKRTGLTINDGTETMVKDLLCDLFHMASEDGDIGPGDLRALCLERKDEGSENPVVALARAMAGVVENAAMAGEDIRGYDDLVESAFDYYSMEAEDPADSTLDAATKGRWKNTLERIKGGLERNGDDIYADIPVFDSYSQQEKESIEETVAELQEAADDAGTIIEIVLGAPGIMAAVMKEYDRREAELAERGRQMAAEREKKTE